MTENRDASFWFDTAPLAAVGRTWNPLGKLTSLLPGRQLSEAQHEALHAFAKANALAYVSWAESGERRTPLPSLVLDGTCEAIVLDDEGTTYLEIGNHGWRYWLGEDDGSPSRRGYIAMRHGLDLPHMYLDRRGPGAATALAAASTVINVAGFFDPERSDPSLTAVDRFRHRALRLDLPTALGFTAYVEREGAPDKKSFGRKAKAEAAREAEILDDRRTATALPLIDGSASALLSELAESFDIEIDREWVFLYSAFGELSTLDPEIWAWAFGAASRLTDLLAIWGEDVGDRRGRTWYTADRIQRPRKADGELRALVPQQGGKLRRILFGGDGS